MLIISLADADQEIGGGVSFGAEKAVDLERGIAEVVTTAAARMVCEDEWVFGGGSWLWAEVAVLSCRSSRTTRVRHGQDYVATDTAPLFPAGWQERQAEESNQYL